MWGPADEPADTWTVLPGTASGDYARLSPPITQLPRGDHAGGLTCIRLNCPEQGRATADPRCPTCGHGTALLRDYRWPRTNLV